jgi:hypothetical protein
MVRPDLRRDMADILKISGPQEREREMWSTQTELLHHGRPTVPSGEPSSQGERADT